MSQYYLMAQLPSLDGLSDTAPLPITEARFSELCGRFLPEKLQEVLKELSLLPPKEPEKTGITLVDRWYEEERQMRIVLAAIRAERLGKPYDQTATAAASPYMLGALRAATEATDPLAAERALDQYRLHILDDLRPGDSFSDEAVVHYGLKLKLLSRIRTFDAEAGRQAYNAIYSSIMEGESQEATS